MTLTKPPLLLTLARQFDLPPKWDGRDVEWQGWEDTLDTFICGPAARQREVCPACGSVEARVINIGLVHPLPGETWEQDHLIEKRTRSGRSIMVKAGKQMVKAHPVLELVAFRCVDCKHDVVWDKYDGGWESGGTWWDLDHTDYGPQGSVSS